MYLSIYLCNIYIFIAYFTSCFYLISYPAGDFVEHCFSQTDLNRRTIVYVINTAVESLSDSLEFKVSDPLGNVGAPHT